MLHLSMMTGSDAGCSGHVQTTQVSGGSEKHPSSKQHGSSDSEGLGNTPSKPSVQQPAGMLPPGAEPSPTSNQQAGFHPMTAQQQLGAYYQQLMYMAMAMSQPQNRGQGGWPLMGNPYPFFFSTPTA